MFRSPSTSSVPHSSATQTRFIQDRIQAVEKHFGELCTSLADYTRKIAGLRDKGDLLAQTLQNYAAAENVSKHCSQAVKEFADSLAFVSDYRDVCVQRIEETVIHEVSSYGTVCKSATEDVRSCSQAYEREVAHHKHVHKLRAQNPLGRMQISKAESDLQQAATQSVRLAKAMEERVDRLEAKKLEDLTGWLRRLTLIEMSFHSSALSVLTRAYRQLNAIDIDADLEEFRNTLRLHLPSPSVDLLSSPARSQSVPTIALPMTPTEKKGTSPTKVKRSKSFSDYRLKAESLDSLKVEEYEELHGVDDSEEDDEEDETEESEEEESPRPRSSMSRRK